MVLQFCVGCDVSYRKVRVAYTIEHFLRHRLQYSASTVTVLIDHVVNSGHDYFIDTFHLCRL
jgi:hypothetical protein